MSTLLLRLDGPLQAWGSQSRFEERDTGQEPTKSGVIGLLCAALGRPRDAPLEDLAALRMGVRVDRPGRLMVDYHTTGGSQREGDRYGVALASGGKPRTVVSRRYYLADASFLVGLEGEDERLLDVLNAALGQPHWQLCLGRKAFVPGVPVQLPPGPPLGPGVRPLPLLEALQSYPAAGTEALRFVLETTPEAGADVRRDVPLSFATRRFATRYVESRWLTPTEVPA